VGKCVVQVVQVPGLPAPKFCMQCGHRLISYVPRHTRMMKPFLCNVCRRAGVVVARGSGAGVGAVSAVSGETTVFF